MKIDLVKVGIVGLGLVSFSHIKAYQSHQNSIIVAICDLDEVQAKSVSEKFGISKYYTSYEAMLKDPEINTIDIATPTYLHASMSLAAIRAGKNVLCEKPFCLTIEEGITVCQEAEAKGVSLMVGESYVFMSSIVKARELIDTGHIGKPQQIRQRFGAWVERHGAIDSIQGSNAKNQAWRMDSAKAGGNGFPLMFDHCVHFFAAAEYLMRDTRIKEIYSMSSDSSQLRAQYEHNNMPGYELIGDIDVPIMTWKYEDDTCQGVWMRAEYLNGKYDSMNGFSMIVSGDSGMIELLGEGGGGLQWNGEQVHLVLHRRGEETVTMRFDEGEDEIWESEVSYYSQAHTNQIHEFVDSLTEGRQSRYSGRDGLRDLRNTIAAICSAKEGIPVQVSQTSDERVSK